MSNTLCFFALMITSGLSVSFWPGLITKKWRGKGGGLMGSLLGAAIIVIWLERLTFNCLSLLVFLSFIAGCLLVPRAEDFLSSRSGQRKRHNGSSATHDFNETVIDEIHGVWLTLLPIFLEPAQDFLKWEKWLLIIIGFMLFRIFDIKKPFGIKKLEQKYPDSFGIMFDDTLAGFYAAIILIIVILIWTTYFH